ncbi:hypothetical protein BY996DRAFT_946949 [Phakopsora pachyrhizi]|nr:hypothetical protein BY996DRAFT_946949 [Phakopsora pachyrhizi]
MKHMDSFAENILMTRNSIENRFNKLFWGESQIQLDQLHRCGSENKLEKILDHKKVPLDKTLVDEWFKKIEHHSNKNFRISALVFLDVIYEQIRINGNECFYITNDQIKNFFSTKKNKTPPILKKINWPLRKKEGYNRPAIYVQKLSPWHPTILDGRMYLFLIKTLI